MSVKFNLGLLFLCWLIFLLCCNPEGAAWQFRDYCVPMCSLEGTLVIMIDNRRPRRLCLFFFLRGADEVQPVLTVPGSPVLSHFGQSPPGPLRFAVGFGDALS